MSDSPLYCGRFAPTPSGPLHFGSLIAALASWLDARASGGQWRVRIEDVDVPRCPAGASSIILGQLDNFGLEWDGEVIYQHQRSDLYQAALDLLKHDGCAYPCGCSRKEWQAFALYPGWCRDGNRHPDRAPAWRLRIAHSAPTAEVSWQDRRMGRQKWPLADLSDVVIKRRDGWWAYQLAVVVDDNAQGITDVVRGADLLDNTPWQLLLQQHLHYPTPHYLHLPLATASNGQKLSKQNLAPALPDNGDKIRACLFDAINTLGQQPPAELRHAPVTEQLHWARHNWQVEQLPSADVVHKDS
ncbi:tRNA glutamyl-Q(34) synthetase GluQRS [Carnimonas nigrificans]|uniref:tRNA glutamyl-Q(34) synthetase GluQRS n=1 Tax=Carnimonas nigrificans TaxID=64323 RepID=UPI00046EA4B5|nr:tRNA glutamyl-Q(34) synthetase GluQRS [Carnimonas nigrificans]